MRRHALGSTSELTPVNRVDRFSSVEEVTRVGILDANPRRVFDRAVVKTLSQWKFTSGGDGRSKEIEIAFKR